MIRTWSLLLRNAQRLGYIVEGRQVRPTVLLRLSQALCMLLLEAKLLFSTPSHNEDVHCVLHSFVDICGDTCQGLLPGA
jgi:hypothetical protein